MNELILPGLILIIGGIILPIFPAKARKYIAVLLPIISCVHLHYLPPDLLLETTMFGYTLNPVRIDKLSMVWGYVFHLAALISVIYQLHVKDTIQDVSGLTYAGAAIGAAVCAAGAGAAAAAGEA